MRYEYEIIDGSLIFKDLSVGNLRTGEPLTWSELRQIVILATRFGQKRPLKDRTLEQLAQDLKSFIDDRVKREKQSDRDKNNLEVRLAASQEYIERQNIQYNELKKAYNELARTIQKPSEGE